MLGQGKDYGAAVRRPDERPGAASPRRVLVAADAASDFELPSRRQRDGLPLLEDKEIGARVGLDLSRVEEPDEGDAGPVRRRRRLTHGPADVHDGLDLSLIHISEPTRLGMSSYAVF